MRYFRVSLIIALIVMVLSCDTNTKLASPAGNYFLKYLGGDGDQWGVDLEVYKDGTFFVLGNSRLTATSDQQLYVAQVDATGNLIWEKELGAAGTDEQARDIEITSDGNLIVAANVVTTAGNRDVFIVKLSTGGDILNSSTLNVSPDSDENVSTITEISDGFIVTGTKDVSSTSISSPPHTKDAFHLRLTSDLALSTNIWRTTHGDGTVNAGVKVFEIDANHFYFFGYTNSPFNKALTEDINFSYWIFQLGSTGEASSNSLYPGSVAYNETSSSVVQTSDGFAMAGTAATGSSNYLYLVKLNQNLSFNSSDYQFSHLFADNSDSDLGTFTNTEYSRTFVNLASPSYYFVLTQQLKTDEQIYLTKIDNRGQYLWKEPVLFGGAGDDFAGAVEELPDGRISVLGTITVGGSTGQKKIVLMKLNSAGKLTD